MEQGRDAAFKIFLNEFKAIPRLLAYNIDFELKKGME